MSNEYRLSWKVERGYYNLGPPFDWLPDGECDFWEVLKKEHDRSLYAEIPRTEAAWARLMGILPPVLKSKIDKDEVKARVDMRALAESYGAVFRGQGRRPVGTCPFHDDKRASFSLDMDRKLYNCFGCGEAGDCFSLVQKKENVTFVEALKILNQEY